MSDKKPILDACCGGKQFWYDQHVPFVEYQDVRDADYVLCDGRKFGIHPDHQGNFTDMAFPDGSFQLVVFDPPHLLHAGTDSWLAKKYGTLPVDWKMYLHKGFCECFRVLKDGGILIFKWNSDQIQHKDVIQLSPYKPLFGDRRSKTRWTVFGKFKEMQGET
jgi:SAM-dependent methyltransferase